jgi:hypothetical protein
VRAIEKRPKQAGGIAPSSDAKSASRSKQEEDDEGKEKND